MSGTVDLKRARSVLKSVFGYEDFRPGQAEIVEAVALELDLETQPFMVSTAALQSGDATGSGRDAGATAGAELSGISRGDNGGGRDR